MVDKNGSNSRLKMTVHVFDKKLDFFANNPLISLSIIGTIGLAIRLFYFPFDVPLVLDALNTYFFYATDTSILVHLLVLHVLPCPDRDGFVRLQIEDTGRGISSDCLTRVFSPQQPGPQSDLLPNLHMSALAAKDLGGSLRVWSDGLNQGATFTVDLPVIHMEETQ